MSDDQPIRITMRAAFLHPPRFASQSSQPTFQWDRWSADLRGYALTAKEGIEAAREHGQRLARYHFYITRLAMMLGKLPEIKDAFTPLLDLRDEIDLLVHHRGSDLLRPAAAPRAMTTVSDKRLRAIATACVRLFRQVGVSEEESREQVARLVLEGGYRGDKGKFGAGELMNWVSKIESGELPGIDFVNRLFATLPNLREATTRAKATGLSREMLSRIRFPPVTAAQAKKQRPIA